MNSLAKVRAAPTPERRGCACSEDAPRNSEQAVAVAMRACSDTDDAGPLSKEGANGDRVVFYRFSEFRQKDEEHTSVVFDWRSLQFWENYPTLSLQGNPCSAMRRETSSRTTTAPRPPPNRIRHPCRRGGSIRSFMNQAIPEGADGKATVITIPGFVQLHRRGCEFVSIGAEDYADSVRPVPAFEKEVPP